MIILPRRKRSVATLRVGLGFVVAGTLLGSAPVDAASTQPYTNHRPLSSNQPGSYRGPAADEVTSGAAQQYPNPHYPNHKPLRGSYPGSYSSTPSTAAQSSNSAFDWLAAGAGATGMLGLILLLAAAKTAMRNARKRRHDVPIVFEIHDDTPSVS
jgi:hypothetical protein